MSEQMNEKAHLLALADLWEEYAATLCAGCDSCDGGKRQAYLDNAAELRARLVVSNEIAEIVRDVLADHIWTPRKKGPAECWSANDRECGERFTTGGEYRSHVAALVADRLSSSPEMSQP